MDNQIFKLNGVGAEALVKALKLFFDLSVSNTDICGYEVNNDFGVIFYKYAPSDRPGFVSVNKTDSAEVIKDIVMEIFGDNSIWRTTNYENFTSPLDIDGDIERGWLLYTGDWGRVGNINGSIFAVQPAYAWHGK